MLQHNAFENKDLRDQEEEVDSVTELKKASQERCQGHAGPEV